MMPARDPPRQLQRRIAVQVAAAWALALAAAVWAWRAAPPAAYALPTTRSAQPAPPPDMPLAAGSWNVELYRPFTDAPAPAAAPASLKLFSILRQGDGLTAAIATPDGLVYAAAGQECKGFTVVRVEPAAVIVRIGGEEQRLGLGP